MKRIILLACLFVILVILAFSLFSCGDEDGLPDQSTCQHQWNEGYQTKAPTDKVKGVKTYTCNLCGLTREEEIPMLTHPSHTYDKQLWAWNDQSHWMVCDFEGCEETTVTSNHLYSSAYQSENGLTCMVCRSVSNAHTFTDKMEYDSNTHWIACDDEGCAAKYGKASHSITMAGKCLKCEYTRISDK